MSSHPSSTVLRQQADSLLPKIRRLTNRQLQAILRQEDLPTSGVKNVLVTRLKNRLDEAIEELDNHVLEAIANAIDPVRRGHTSSTGSATATNTSAPYHSSPSQNVAFNMLGSGYPFMSHRNAAMPAATPGTGPFHCPFTYRKSPFYEIIKPLSNPLELRRLENNRETTTLLFVLNESTVTALANDKSLRVMLFSAAEQKYDQPQSAPRHIAFPHNIDVRVNGEEFKTNMKGIKNKPGTTKPADITAFVRTKQSGHKNTISVLYALTRDKYYMNVMLVRKKSVQQLADIVRAGKFISRQQVLKEMKSKAEDPDIVATSTVLSLKDPISYIRITSPCRSTVCTHMQCFEINFLLELQEQAPQWTCPICSKHTPFETLAIDEYVKDILQNTSTSTDQVTLEPDGQWSALVHESSSKPGPDDGDDDDDVYDNDDIIEVTSSKTPHLKLESPSTPFALDKRVAAPQPSSYSRHQANGGAGTKRKAEVIDLTLSDDDEPAPKRPTVSQTAPRSVDSYRSLDHSANMPTLSLSPVNSFQPPSIANELYPNHFPQYGGTSPFSSLGLDFNGSISRPPFAGPNSNLPMGTLSHNRTPNSAARSQLHPAWGHPDTQYPRGGSSHMG